MAQSVSPTWRTNVVDAPRSSTFVAHVEILDPQGNVQWQTFGNQPNFMTVSAGSVTEDRTRSIWGTADVTIDAGTHGPDEVSPLVPTTATSLLSPLSGATFRVWLGYLWPGQTQPEWVPCGLYDIVDSEISDTAAGSQIRLIGEDLTGRLDVADLYKPVTINAGTLKLDAVKFLVSTVMPNAVYFEDPSDNTAELTVLAEQTNRLGEIRNILDSIGFDISMDRWGQYTRLTRTPQIEAPAAWVYQANDLTPIQSTSNALSRRRVYNGVIVKGENLNSDVPPVYAEVWDDDPSSPTYFTPTLPVGTTIGPRPYFMTSQWITTTDQATAAGQAQLRKIKGLLQRVSFTALANPAMNVGDIVQVTNPATGVNGLYMVERTQLDLSGEPMTIALQERRV